MKCLDCEESFEAETPDDMMKAMMPHYMGKHSEMMKGQNDESKADWMKRFQKEWEEAEEI